MTRKLQPDETLCLVDHKECSLIDGVCLRDLDPRIQQLIRRDFPRAKKNDFICSEHLVHYRLQLMDHILMTDTAQNQKINDRMTRLMASENYQTVDVNEELEQSLTMGQKVADAVARFGGSWGFIISFIVIMILWMIINVLHLFGVRFDPYPFILLNLFLSMLAAIQAPLIMMSQNRAAEHDRLQAKDDFRVNSKSEEEIRVLHAKVDHLIQQDVPNMLAIQKSQTQMLAELEQQLHLLRENQNRM